MVRGYWRYVFATGCFIAVPGIWAGAERTAIWVDSPHSYPDYRETPEEAQQRLQSLTIAEAAKASQQQRPCQNPRGHEASDLCAQWRAADAAERASRWALWQLFLSGIGIFGLLATLMQGRKALDRARDANRIAEAAVSADRPWIDIDVAIVEAPVVVGSDIELKTVISFTNFGNQFAVDVGTGFDIRNMLVGDAPLDKVLSSAKIRRTIIAPSRTVSTNHTFSFPIAGWQHPKGFFEYMMQIRVVAVYRHPSFQDEKCTLKNFTLSDKRRPNISPMRSDNLPEKVSDIFLGIGFQGQIAT